MEKAIIKAIDVRNHPYYEGKRAKMLSSLATEGHILIGKYDTRTQLHSYMRHPNGNRTEVVVTRFHLVLFINGKIRKMEQLNAAREAGKASIMCQASYVKNPKPKVD